MSRTALKDFINFLHNDREQYYKKTDKAQFLRKILNPNYRKFRDYYQIAIAVLSINTLFNFGGLK